MKYLLLIYSHPESWGHPVFLHTKEGLALSAADRDALAGELDRLITETTASGELLSVEALADPVTARTVRVRDEVPVVTDGPFVEAKEQMAGVFVLDCTSQERAEEIAARFPEARFGAVELRPIMGSSGQEM